MDAQTRKDVRKAVVVTVLIGGLFGLGAILDARDGDDPPPAVEQVEGGDKPNSDYERCIADDECLRDLLEFTERDK